MLYRFEDYQLDELTQTLSRRGTSISVEPKVFDLLVLLLRHRRRVVTRDEVLGRLWRGTSVSNDSISRLVKEARRAVGDCGDRQTVIQTVRGRGFRFVASVESESRRGEPEEVERLFQDAEKNLEAALEDGARDLRRQIRHFVLMCRVAVQTGRESERQRG